MVFEEEARRAAEPKGPARRAATAFVDLADDFFHGRPFDPTKVASAINEVAWGIGGNFTSYHPDLEDSPPPRTPFTPPPDPRQAQAPRWHREEPPPPQPVEDLAAMHEARRVLGFGPRDVITKEALRARHRDLALKHHPDRKGGSLARMQQVNAAVDVLSKSL